MKYSLFVASIFSLAFFVLEAFHDALFLSATAFALAIAFQNLFE